MSTALGIVAGVIVFIAGAGVGARGERIRRDREIKARTDAAWARLQRDLHADEYPICNPMTGDDLYQDPDTWGRA